MCVTSGMPPAPSPRHAGPPSPLQYMDMALHPLMLNDSRIFLKEGWHYQLSPEVGAAWAPVVVLTSCVALHAQPFPLLYTVCTARLCLDHLLQGNLSYSGVVMSEMKGEYSSPDSLHGIIVQQALFANNSYRWVLSGCRWGGRCCLHAQGMAHGWDLLPMTRCCLLLAHACCTSARSAAGCGACFPSLGRGERDGPT